MTNHDGLSRLEWFVVKVLLSVIVLPFVIPIVACAVIFLIILGIAWILKNSSTAAFKRILRYIDDQSFNLSVVIVTTLLGWYQLPHTPFYVYVSIVSSLVVLKWLRGSECGILKDSVCYLMYKMNIQWMFRNFCVLGIKLHGCHPVSKIVFENFKFLMHEGTRIVNPDIRWQEIGIWDPPQLDSTDASTEAVRGQWRRQEPIEFPVDKGPLDGGDNHCYRVNMRYKESLVRYWVDYLEIKRPKDVKLADPEKGSTDSAGESTHNRRGCTDDFVLKMSEEQAFKFYCYVQMLNSETKKPLISTMDEYCHCETMLNVAKLIVKGDDFYEGEFDCPIIFA